MIGNGTDQDKLSSTDESEIEDKGWVAFVCDADYRKRLLSYTADVKKINKLAQVCIDAFHSCSTGA